jgi:hypothetical protein
MSISTASFPALRNISFDKGIFSNAEMRGPLEKYYASEYAPLHDRIAAMKESASNQATQPVYRTQDGQTGVEFSAAQYEAIIPSFDQWLEIQQNSSLFDTLNADSPQNVESALNAMAKAWSPDGPSDVLAVFSQGNHVLGYVNQEGGVTTHTGGGILQKIAEKADDLNLVGQAKIAYIKQYGGQELSRIYKNLNVTEYNEGNMPTRRDFMQKWYPDVDVDQMYQTALQEVRLNLEEKFRNHQQKIQTLSKMHHFLIQSMEDA